MIYSWSCKSHSITCAGKLGVLTAGNTPALPGKFPCLVFSPSSHIPHAHQGGPSSEDSSGATVKVSWGRQADSPSPMVWGSWEQVLQTWDISATGSLSRAGAFRGNYLSRPGQFPSSLPIIVKSLLEINDVMIQVCLRPDEEASIPEEGPFISGAEKWPWML